MSSQYFPPYVVSKNNNIKAVLDLRGYAKEDDLKHFRGKDYIQNNYLTFKPKHKYFKSSANGAGTTVVLSWKSKGFSNEKIVSSADPQNDTSPWLKYSCEKLYLDFFLTV